jgi:hypothetical protein
MAPDGSKPEHSEELRRPLRNVQICPITRNPTQEWAYSSQLQAASRVDFRRTVLDRDVVRKALPTHQLTTSNCEHQTHTCSHCSMTTLGRQAAVIRLCNQILRAAAQDFTFRLASGSSTTHPDGNLMEIHLCTGRLFDTTLLQDSSRR